MLRGLGREGYKSWGGVSLGLAGWVGGQMDGWTDGWVGEWMDGWVVDIQMTRRMDQWLE